MRLAKGKYYSYFDGSEPSTSAASLVVAGLDINIRSVRAALIELDMSDVKIINQVEVFFPKGIDPGDSNSLVIFKNSCQRALKMVRQESAADPQSVVVSLSGHLIKGITQMIEVNRPNPRLPLSSQEIDGVCCLRIRRPL